MGAHAWPYSTVRTVACSAASGASGRPRAGARTGRRRRAASRARRLAALGYARDREYRDGIQDRATAGLPVESGVRS
ncbi:hypothetical protein [Streptosporangium saharense]|uniref:Uncharacterized protein n=1 Tax=Streptosporangium saharense TaxID=1706840 RepID=A0A7W7QMB0_9ACTN|nr:hypothetical protein [Streptosporangium saharense]MBB4916142.1 hypothetical protein [Streptosporangium saharense]